MYRKPKIIIPPPPANKWIEIRGKLKDHGWSEECPRPRYWVFSRCRYGKPQKLYIDFYRKWR